MAKGVRDMKQIFKRWLLRLVLKEIYINLEGSSITILVNNKPLPKGCIITGSWNYYESYQP